MSGTKWTPGRWRDDWNGGKGLTGPTTSAAGGACCDPNRDTWPVSIGAMTAAICPLPESGSREEMLANARLIASAPDLYDALLAAPEPPHYHRVRRDVWSPTEQAYSNWYEGPRAAALRKARP